MRFVFAMLLLMGMGRVAMATPCPTVGTNISDVNPTIIGAPHQVQLSTYDLATGGLAVQYAGQGNKADYFVGVPKQLVTGHAYTPWAAIENYPRAIVQEGSYCPILTAGGFMIGTSLEYPTTTPHVTFPCSLISDNTQIVSIGVIAPPFAIYQATYDRKTNYLAIQFVNGMTALFVGIPLYFFQNYTTVWNNLAPYLEALMVQGSSCPVLLQP